WFGHCDVKATVESVLADMHQSGSVSEFRSDSGKVVVFERSDLLEALASILNFGEQYVPIDANAPYQNNIKTLGVYDSASGRFDDQPADIRFETNDGQTYNVKGRLTTLSEKNKPRVAADLNAVFSSKIADSLLQSFTDNPNLISVEDVDTNFVDVSDRRFEAT